METLPGTIESVLEVLATRFGTTIEHLWTIMVRQAIMEGVVYLLFLVALILFTRYAPKWLVAREIGNSADRALAYGIAATMIGLMWFTMLIIGSIALPSLLNPEYWALKQVLGLFSGG